MNSSNLCYIVVFSSLACLIAISEVRLLKFKNTVVVARHNNSKN